SQTSPLSLHAALPISHPECSHEVCDLADQVGSTDYIIRAVEAAPAGSVIGVGTEIHLVNRLNDETPDKTVVSLDPLVCPCSTMFRIDAPHLCWVLENLVDGTVVNQITVDPDSTEWAKIALLVIGAEEQDRRCQQCSSAQRSLMDPAKCVRGRAAVAGTCPSSWWGAPPHPLACLRRRGCRRRSRPPGR